MSGTATLERKGGSAPVLAIPGMQHKAVAVTDLAPKSGILAVDPDKGLVRAIVSVTGIVDNVDDRILPGAYTKTLAKRKPKGVWSHDWKDWVSRTEEIEEYMPGDARLPKETKDGKPWPKEAGALVVTTRFNMKSARSTEAFQAVEFFSETGECEWSIGYVVPPGQATRDTKGVRNIKSLDLFEYGPVLFGAASESMTLSVKSLGGDGARMRETMEGLGGTGIGESEALPDGSFKIATKADLSAALRAYPRALDRLEAKSHIVGRAVVLDAADALPKGWLEEHQVKATAVVEEPVEAAVALTDEEADTLDADEEALALAQAEEPDVATFSEVKSLEVKYNTGPVGEPGGKQNWVDKVGGLPKFIRAIAHALIREGKDDSTAIRMAIGTVKRWAAGGGDVTAKTKAKAAKALAEWEAKKAKARGTKTAEVEVESKTLAAKIDSLVIEPFVEPEVKAYDPTVEVKGGIPDVAVESKMYGTPSLPGSHEQVREALRTAIQPLLRGAVVSTEHGYTRYEWSDVSVTATFDDHVIVTRVNWDESPSKTESFSIDYAMDTATGEVTLGEPEKVRLSVVTVVEEEKSIDGVDAFTGLPDMIATVIEGTKAMLAVGVETKAGRVLSNANETRLRAAAEHLFAVLRAAGIGITDPGENRQKPVETLHDVDTTAPSGGIQQAATGGSTAGVKAEPALVETKSLDDGSGDLIEVALDPFAYAASLRRQTT